jgi:hypothetical protein
MQAVMDFGEVALVATRGRGAATPLRLTTTLYELMAALQAVVAPDDDAPAVPTVVHLLRSSRLTWLRTDNMLRCPSRRQMTPPQPRGSPPSRRGQGLVPHASVSQRPREGAVRTRPCEEEGFGWQLSTSGFPDHEVPTVSNRRSDL